MNRQDQAEPDREDYLKQLIGIMSHYEINLPYSAEELLAALEELDNPHELMQYLDVLHQHIAKVYDGRTAAALIPELSAIHAQLPRPKLANLSYTDLEAVLRDTETRSVDSRMGFFHTVRPVQTWKQCSST